jgi:hypothetical protein
MAACDITAQLCRGGIDDGTPHVSIAVLALMVHATRASAETFLTLISQPGDDI